MLTFHRRAMRGFSKTSLLMSAAAAVLLAGCSNSVERFSSNPSDSDPVYTASVPKTAAGNSGDDRVTSRPLAQAPISQPYNYSASNQTPIYKQPVSQAPATASVTVGQGMTLYSIAKANNLTVAKLAAANNLRAPYAVHQGQVLRIPGASEAVVPQVRSTSQETAVRKTGTSASAHQVASGETLFSLGRKYSVSPYAIADLNGLSRNASLQLGQQIKVPGSNSATVAAAETAPVPVKNAVETTKADIEDSAATPATAPKDAVAQAVPSVTSDAPAPQVTADAGMPGMRWPVRGKIISEFGAKPNGLKNEGINIAVPEGTSVRAADDGVVAYAGNELKGYGNLVLIRHANGFVTAYAHAKELFVKRGDAVKRGDVIAKAGQTGSVSSPQLHFEVRKGAAAMDPLKFLSSATASN